MTQTDTNPRDWGRLKRLALECEEYGGLRTPEYEAAANPATVLELIAEVERLKEINFELQSEESVSQLCFDKVVKDRDALKAQRDEMAEALDSASAILGRLIEHTCSLECNAYPQDYMEHGVSQTTQEALDLLENLRRARSSLNKTEKTDG